MKLELELRDELIEAEICESRVIITIRSKTFPEDPNTVIVLNERELKSLIQFLKGVYYIFKGTKS